MILGPERVGTTLCQSPMASSVSSFAKNGNCLRWYTCSPSDRAICRWTASVFRMEGVIPKSIVHSIGNTLTHREATVRKLNTNDRILSICRLLYPIDLKGGFGSIEIRSDIYHDIERSHASLAIQQHRC